MKAGMKAGLTTIVAGVFSLALAIAGVSALAQSQTIQRQATPQGGVISNTITATGTLQSIDKDARTLTVLTDDGKELEVDAPPDADLNAFKVGEKVDVDYREAFAVDFKEPGTPLSGPTDSKSGHRAAAGAAALHEVTAVAEVVKVDAKNNKVTFRGPRGNIRTIAVKDPQMQQKAQQLKPGDKVQFTYSEASAVAIRPKQMK